jgi:hypothetical protein
VNGAYRVIDEYLRQGQRMAEQFWLPAGDAGTPMDNVGKVFERFVRSASEMGTAWMEMMGQWGGPAERRGESPRGVAGPFTAGEPRTNGHAVVPAPSASAPPALGVSVEASRKFRVQVELAGPVAAAEVEISRLVAKEPGGRPLRGVRLDAGTSGAGVTLKIRVPAGQPAGEYRGVLLDRRTGEPRGIVLLTLS